LKAPKVDLSFTVAGATIPVDHGFALYGAVSRILPQIHEDNDVGIRLIRGRYAGDGILNIFPKGELVLRLSVDRIAPYLVLAGKHLDISGQSLTIGTMHTRALIPSVALHAHIVTTKNGNDPNRFESEITHQLNGIGIQGKAMPGKRRTFSVHGKQVVGYSLLVSELTAEESIALQENGLGGRRKMGCGFFEVWKG
jgi:CRISPR-associated protein Cas6